MSLGIPKQVQDDLSGYANTTMSLRGGTTKQSHRVLMDKNSYEIATLRSQ